MSHLRSKYVASVLITMAKKEHGTLVLAKSGVIYIRIWISMEFQFEFKTEVQFASSMVQAQDNSNI